MNKLASAARKKFVQNEMISLRSRSGVVESEDKLVSFLYELMRDEITPGKVEHIVLNSTGPESDKCLFTNGYLADYAKDVAKRLRK